ncbi:MAG: hypothetical protein HY917_00530 [Candidatus Diapherotrites archaeon]|nr:hypothetical protein [Candidatus Diapherotrites archaeon]
MDRFKESIRGKKILFIEGDREMVDGIIKTGKFSRNPSVRAYQKLILEAHTPGLNVKSLDTVEANRIIDPFSALKHPNPLMRELLLKTNYYVYHMYNQREKRWLRLLEGTNKDAIVVMHPEHAESIAEKLKIPKDNYIREPRPRYPDPFLPGMMRERRMQANAFAEKANRERIERARQRARMRMGKVK